MNDHAIAFQAGGSFPRDGYIEAAIASRLGNAFVTYASLLYAYQEGRHIDHIGTRVETLRRLLCDRAETAFVLMGRSSGARAVTQLALERPPNLRGIVCLGYPFRHPEHPPEPERVAHLAEVAVPTLIVQGAGDVYGGTDAVGLYALSPRITVEFVEASHEFDLSPQTWDDIAGRIRRFLDGLPFP